MLIHYIKIASRNLIRHKGYSWINILGLAIGMASSILILLFVQDELSYDQFHEKRDRIYRVGIEWQNNHSGGPVLLSQGPYRLAESLRVDFPEIDQVVRLYPFENTVIRRGAKRFTEERFFFVDPNFFEVFTFSLLKGDSKTALRDPYTIVITEAIAQKYFGDENPIGQSLTWDDNEMTVTGIVAEASGNAHFHFDFLASMTVAQQEFSSNILSDWGEGSSYTYLLFPDNLDPAEVAARFPAFVEKNFREGGSALLKFSLLPLTDIHLYAHTNWEIEPNGDVTYAYALSAIAFFILLIACINFMNLTTARSANRAKEVGLRKVVGAYRTQLVQQFLGEVILLSMIGMMAAIILVLLALPWFNGFVDKNLTFDLGNNAGLVSILTSIVLFVGLVAGCYPALFLSRFKPVEILKGKLTAGKGGVMLRRILVTFQFSVSIFLLIVTLIIFNQVTYATHIKLGYDKDHVLAIPNVPQNIRMQYPQVVRELTAYPEILYAAASSRVPPGRLGSNIGTRPEGVPADQAPHMKTIWIDFDLLELLDLTFVAGRSFSRDFLTDATAGFVLNEAAVRSLGWSVEDAIGKQFGSNEITAESKGQWIARNGQVIGVVKDAHFESLHEEIGPTVFFIAPQMTGNYLIRIQPENIPQTLEKIEAIWKKYSPDQPFEYYFIDETFDALYRTEKYQMTILGLFASLAIFIGCLGLIGLASFSAEKRTKEIGIRKVLGASVSGIIVLLSKEFLMLVLAANILAWPLAYYAMDLWLSDFVYRADITIITFVFSGLSALIIAGLTIGFQAMRAAVTDPIKALRYE